MTPKRFLSLPYRQLSLSLLKEGRGAEWADSEQSLTCLHRLSLASWQEKLYFQRQAPLSGESRAEKIKRAGDSWQP